MSDVKAGGAYVEISAREKGLKGTLNRASAQLKGFAAAAEDIGSKLGLTLSAAAITAPIVQAVRAYTELGSALVDMSGRTGIAIESLSALQFAAEQSGSSLPDLEAGIRKMQQTIADAAGGSTSATAALQKLGITLQELTGKSPDEQFRLIAARIAEIKDPTMRAAVAMDILGKSGTKLLPLMANLDESVQAARDAGLVMSTEAAEAAERLGDSLDLAATSAKFTAAALGESLAPTIEMIVGVIVRWGGALAELIKAHPQLTATIAAAVAAAGLMTIAVTTLSAALPILSASLVALAANPVGLAFIAMAAAAGALAVALANTGTETDALLAKTTALREKGDELRASDMAKLARLQELAAAQRLNAAEMAEATTLIGDLESRYGDLGMSLDQTTGKILGVSDATRQLHEVMADKAAAEVAAEMAVVRQALAETQEYMAALGTAWGNFWRLGLGDFDAAANKATQLQARLAELEERQRRLAGGDTSAASLTGDKNADERKAIQENAREIEKAAKAREKAAADSQSAQEKLAQLEEAMANKKRSALERELADIKKHFIAKRKLLDEAIAAEEKLNDPARKPILDDLKQQRASLMNDYSVATREATEKDRETREQERKDKFDADIGQTRAENATLEVELDTKKKAAAIRADKTKTDEEKQEALRELDRDKQRKLLDLEERAEIAKIEADKDATPEEIQARVEETKRGFNLRREILDTEEGAEEAKRKFSVGGTFNANAVFGLGTGDAASRTAKATEETAKNTKRLLERDGKTTFK